MKLSADKRGDHYILNGTQDVDHQWSGCRRLVVYAKTDPAAGRAALPRF